jgi:acyl-CoA synthetase (AMP-forming)/AMP-acid ligase II
MPVAYGLSETCSGFASHFSDTPRELLKASMGRLLPGNRLRIVDPGTGRTLGPNEDGELAIAGPTLMERYVKADREDCFDADGFFHTGDAGFFDEDGYVHWTGRRSEMIKTGGAPLHSTRSGPRPAGSGTSWLRSRLRWRATPATVARRPKSGASPTRT